MNESLIQGLMIPRDFIKKYGRQIPDVCILDNLFGYSWSVFVNKKGGDFLLEKGWSHFVNENCLQDFDMLTFSFDGVSKFYVQVFMKNCLLWSNATLINLGDDLAAQHRRTEIGFTESSTVARHMMPPEAEDHRLENLRI